MPEKQNQLRLYLKPVVNFDQKGLVPQHFHPSCLTIKLKKIQQCIKFSSIHSFMRRIYKIKIGSFPTIRQIGVILQGYLIFLPIVIFSDILLAFAVGISIHYLQYLSISWRVCKLGFLFSMKIVLFLLIFYSILSTAALSGFFTLERISIFLSS